MYGVVVKSPKRKTIDIKSKYVNDPKRIEGLEMMISRQPLTTTSLKKGKEHATSYDYRATRTSGHSTNPDHFGRII